MLPPLAGELRRKGRVAEVPADLVHPGRALRLNQAQGDALAAAIPTPLAFQASLLQGVTGSGKTEVYLAAAASAIEQGLQALLLVPEINLTPQLEHRIASSLSGVRVAVLHSRLGAAHRPPRPYARPELSVRHADRLRPSPSP